MSVKSDQSRRTGAVRPCFNRFRLAYRRHHSTETALLRVLNDAYCSDDNKSRTLLVQLDLSAAFDTIDQSTLLRRLERTSSLSDSVIRFIQSYIRGRSQYVRVSQKQSTTVSFEYVVLQGSLLGPLLNTSYVAPVASFDVNHMQYADDTQHYIALDNTSSKISLDSCFVAVEHWFAFNGLSLNLNKSEVIVISTSAQHRSEGVVNVCYTWHRFDHCH